MAWQLPVKSVSPATGATPWLPRWEVVLLHARADGHVTGADGHPARRWFDHRHDDPRTPAFDWTTQVGRDSPGRDQQADGSAVSAAALPARAVPSRDPLAKGWEPHRLLGGEIHQAGDGRSAHQRDWDFLGEWLGRERQRRGTGDDPRAVLTVIAAMANSRRGLTHPSRHPVDVAHYSSFCVGGGNLAAALCHLAGIPARVLHTATHTMAEAWVDGGWRFIDTFDPGTRARWKADPRGGEPREWFEHGLLQLALDPAAMPAGLPAEQVARYHEEQPLSEPWISPATRHWRFGQCALGHDRTHDPVADGTGTMVAPGPASVRALYPEWSQPRHLARDGAPGELVLNPRQGWCQVACALDRGMAMRQSFWLGALGGSNPARGLRLDLHLVDSFGCGFDPVRAGWTLTVNGRSVALDDGAWQLRGGVLSLHVPLAVLKEQAVNEAVLGSERPYVWKPDYRMPDVLWFWTMPEVLGRAEPWYEPGQRGQFLDWFPNFLVQGNHSAYLVAPHAV
ncbi:MAG: transglutaminase domain-containing protein [Planctomycetes bacterium]|nr:transglutaminase domain-containing protein [Planctomycetota bacterium]